MFRVRGCRMVMNVLRVKEDLPPARIVNPGPERALSDILKSAVRREKRMSRFDWLAAMRVGAPLVLSGAIGALAPAVASGEIYGWVDPSGDVTYSNLPPPKNAKVFDVIQETPTPTPEA